jgi:hypothetical protein
MGLRVAEGVASQNKFRGSDRNGGDARPLESGREEPGAETFAEGGEAIEKLGACSDASMNGNFVEKVTSQELQLAAHAKAFLLAELQIVEHIEVKIQEKLGFVASVGEFTAGKRPRNGKEMVSDALHGGDDHGDTGQPGGGSNEACGMEHAVRTEKRTAAKFEGDDLSRLPAYPASVVNDLVMSGRGMADS